MDELFTGVLGDPREDIKVTNGYKSEELIAASSPVEWKAKTIDQLKQYPIWSQNGSGSCVAFAKAKQIAIEIFRLTGVWIDLSPASIYQLRVNQGTPGMNIADANDIVNKRGVTLDALMESQNLTEEQINTVKRTKVADMMALAIAEAVRNYIYVTKTADSVAQVLEKGHAVSFLIFAQPDEYTDVPQIKYPNLTYNEASIRHEVDAVDYFLYQGGKAFWIEDSWGIGHGNGGRRTFTEDFFLKRVIMADYFDSFSFDEGLETTKPKYTFNNTLRFSAVFNVNNEVKILQDVLKYEGLFPNDQDSTGYYGALTAKAVLAFQNKHGVYHDNLEGKIVGPKTRAKLNELYS